MPAESAFDALRFWRTPIDCAARVQHVILAHGAASLIGAEGAVFQRGLDDARPEPRLPETHADRALLGDRRGGAEHRYRHSLAAPFSRGAKPCRSRAVF